MAITLRQLADLVKGKFQGDGDLVINAARPVGEAQLGDITFIENEKHAGHLQDCKASAAVVPASIPTNGLAVIPSIRITSKPFWKNTRTSTWIPAPPNGRYAKSRPGARRFATWCAAMLIVFCSGPTW